MGDITKTSISKELYDKVKSYAYVDRVSIIDLTNKIITEYLDNRKSKIIFGSGYCELCHWSYCRPKQPKKKRLLNSEELRDIVYKGARGIAPTGVSYTIESCDFSNPQYECKKLKQKFPIGYSFDGKKFHPWEVEE